MAEAQRDVSAPRPPERASEPSADRASLVARLAIALTAIAAFASGLDNALMTNWDDERFLRDPDVVSPSLAGLVGFFTEVRYEAYHPLHLLSYWIDVPFVGNEGPTAALVIHAVNLALWVGVLLVGFEVFRRLGLSVVAAAVGVLAFGIHPLAVEVVTWATCRKDIVAIGLALGATYFHLRAPLDGSPWRDRDAWIGRALFVCAALAKTSVLPLPLALLAIDLWLGRRSLRAAILWQLPTLLTALGLGAVVIAVWIDNDMIRSSGTDDAPYSPDLVPATLFHLLQSAVWPVRLSAIYPLHRHDPTPIASSIAAVVLVLLGLAFAYRERARPGFARLGVGLSWFVIFALPVLNIIPMFFQWQDRYCVAPLIGLAFLLGSMLDELRTAERRETTVRIAVTSAVVLAPLLWRTVQQVDTWRDADHLWGNAVRNQPRAYFAWAKLGETRRNRGDLDGSIRALAEAIEIAPELRLAHAGFVYSLGLRDEARERLPSSQALELANRFMVLSDDAARMRELAAEMVDAGYHDAALYVLGRSLDLDPVSDERLERAVSVHLTNGDYWLARFYLSRMSRRPMLRDVTAFWEAERERLGLITDEEREAREERIRAREAGEAVPGEPTVIDLTGGD
jgi:protein O-mannosyl-transferase